MTDNSFGARGKRLLPGHPDSVAHPFGVNHAPRSFYFQGPLRYFYRRGYFQWDRGVPTPHLTVSVTPTPHLKPKLIKFNHRTRGGTRVEAIAGDGTRGGFKYAECADIVTGNKW